MSAVSQKPRRRRFFSWKRLLLAGAVATPIAVGALWVAVHSIPWMGPLVANTLRAIIGKENVTSLEEFVYSIEDKVNHAFKGDTAPKTYWDVPSEAPTATAVEGAGGASGDELALPPFHLEPVGPAVKEWSAEGDGEWVPMPDPRHPQQSPRMFKTLLHPDKSRSWAEVFVVAIDLRSVAVMPVMGYQEPRSEKKEAADYERPAKIPKDDWDALLAAFNGGFMAEHGHYGVYFDGITFIDPKDDACTFARYDDGSFDVATWSRIKERQGEMTWYRQAPNCMYEDGEINENLRVHRARKWGATLDGNTVIRRSAVGISEDRQVLFVGISNHTNAKVMALGMHHAGSHAVAQMDVNWSYPKFVTYEPDDDGELIPVALADGFEFDENLYLHHRSMRDFFYLARKEDIVVHSPNASADAKPAPANAAPVDAPADAAPADAAPAKAAQDAP